MGNPHRIGWGIYLFYYRILFVEIGVGLAVMGLLIAIYDDLLEGGNDHV